MAFQLTAGKFTASADNGAPASGFKLYTYVSGTTTPLTTYTSATLLTPNTNPVILNARGEADIWLGQTPYTFVLKTAADAVVWTVDGVASPDASQFYFTQAGTGAVTRTALAKIQDVVNVKDYGAACNGVTDDAAAIQAAITANPTRVINIDGTCLMGAGLDLSAFSGVIRGSGKLLAKSGVSIAALVTATSATGFSWDGVSIDMAQTALTTTANARCQNAIYVKDCRNLTFSNFRITNAAADDDRLIYVDGTSSNAPSAANGSQDIVFENIYGEGFISGTVDIGPQVLIRSDFYTGTNGSVCIANTNGVKAADYSEDTTVSFGRTTKRITFTNCTFKGLDRFAMINASDVTIDNVTLVDFNTRGFVGTQTCANIKIDNCKVSGNAAHFAFNYAPINVNISNCITQGKTAVIGQRALFVFGLGAKHIRVSNVTGYGTDLNSVLLQGVYDVSFDSVTIKNEQGGGSVVNVAIEVDSGESGNTASGWITDRITFSNCEFECRYGMQFEAVTGSATTAKGAVLINNTHFKNITSLFTGTTPTANQIQWMSGKVDVPGTLSASAFTIAALAPIGTEIFPTSASWTPVLAGSTTAGSNTLTTSDARFYRIGNLCYFEGAFVLSVKDAAMAGNLEIRGLPFVSATRTNAFASVNFSYMQGVTFPANFTTLTGVIGSNSSTIGLRRLGSGQSGASVAVSEIAAGAYLVFSGCYLVA